MQLYAAHAGRGYPLVILHGLFGSAENWQTLSRAWAAFFREHYRQARQAAERGHGAEPGRG